MKNLLKRIGTGSILVISFILIFVISKPIFTSIIFLLLLGYIIFFEYTKLFNYKEAKFWIILPFYPVLPFILISYMSYFQNYRELVFYLFILAQIQDVGAYIFGSLFGKHKIAPKLSPKKSWEGFFGGYLFSILTLLAILYSKIGSQFSILLNTKIIFFIAIFSLAVSIFATAGDLFESFLKRKAGIKDTGKILPGHGGLLDRLDSCLLLIFVFFLLRDYLLKIFCI